MAGAAALLHAAVQAWPQVLPFIPVKYTGIVTVVGIAIAAYHTPPPSGKADAGTAALLIVAALLVASGFTMIGAHADREAAAAATARWADAAGLRNCCITLARQDDESDRYARILTVSWNIRPAHKLTWTVEYGHADERGSFEGVRTEAYMVDPDSGTISLGSETRGFTKETADLEAERLHALLDALAEYAAVSTEWWKLGRGERRSEERRVGKECRSR